MKPVEITRKTKETDIQLTLSAGTRKEDGVQPTIQLNTSLPFIDHMLHAFAFHGDWNLDISATGDIDVDPHHLIEDLGIVLGQALVQLQEQSGSITRYGSAIIPMDDALCEVVIDLCNRPYLVYKTHWPQPYIGSLDTALFREFFYAFAANARCNLHLHCRWGENSHHIIEALFKACGIAARTAAQPIAGNTPLSTKGSL